MTAERGLLRLQQRLSEEWPLAVAVSGGVDSMTLAVVAHRHLPGRVAMFHAVSPAVPAEATERVKSLAVSEGWALRIIDAGEFGSTDYLANPVNRCFYCKTHLYGAIATQTRARIVSGTNTDDLGEYRPGLEAAKGYGVRHPYVECEIDKASVRTIARTLELDDIAELPSAPCLASRIETGIGIRAATLDRVHSTEKLMSLRLFPRTVRCRVRPRGIVIELDNESLARLDAPLANELRTEITRIFAEDGIAPSVLFEPYRTGSAFIGGHI